MKRDLEDEAIIDILVISDKLSTKCSHMSDLSHHRGNKTAQLSPINPENYEK